MVDYDIQTSCCRDKVMMACKERDSTELKVLAWAPRGDVFGLTDVAMCGSSGSFSYQQHYYYKDKGNGFVDLSGWRWRTESDDCNQRQCQRGHCGEGINTGYQGEDYSKPNCGTCVCNNKGDCEGNVSNGVRWYQTDGDKAAWGFAAEDSDINLYWVDVASDESDDKRLSIHLNDNGVFEGGHRCGSKLARYNDVDGNSFDDDDGWELVFYHAN